jgi:hypothetical protein
MKSSMILNIHAIEQEGLATTPFHNRSGRYLPRFRTCHVICHTRRLYYVTGGIARRLKL